jgi:flagellar biosynthesis/type III secretory pathway protein FliH
MARLLRDVVVHAAPVTVPLPGSWDAAAEQAFETGRLAGREEGFAEGHATGRQELAAIADRVVEAVARCGEQVARAHADLVERVVEVAQLYVQAVVRHVPDASALGMLARIEEALVHLEPAPFELLVPADVVDDLSALFAARDDRAAVTVVAGTALAPGEFTVRSAWSQADGTWENYLEAARNAIETYLVERGR